ncbi:MAG: orotidine-5'-phosphate decarboxylase [Caldisericia bacterium]|nr:orotidine-5'-phosphate decarboxylase [Caldisericia bacterium]
MNAKERLIVSLDFPDIQKAQSLRDLLKDDVLFYKIGLQMFLRYGFQIVNEWKNFGKKVFLDLKLSDIPNTVSSAIRTLSVLEVDMINMHALSGYDCMRMAAETAKEVIPESKLIAVTVLTSFTDKGLQEIGIPHSPAGEVKTLCKIAKKAGLSGVVSSPWEANSVKNICGEDFITVCPGIRRSTDAIGDQARIMTPSKAIKNGADYLVVGRPIIKASDPKEAAISILKEIENAIQ